MKRTLRRGLLPVGLAATMAVAAAAPASADPPPVTGGGSQGKGAIVFHCSQFGLGNGVLVITPSGRVNENNCF